MRDRASCPPDRAGHRRQISALVLTLDLQVLGQRHADVKNGMTVPPEIRDEERAHVMTKPAWAISVSRGKRRNFGNLAGHVRGTETSSGGMDRGSVRSLADWKDVTGSGALARQADPQRRSRRGGRRSRQEPVQPRLVVSNHGGRQLDGAPHRSPPCRRSSMRSAARSRSFRRRDPLRAGRVARPRAWRALLHDRPRLHLRPGRSWRGGRRQGDRRSSARSWMSPWR